MSGSAGRSGLDHNMSPSPRMPPGGSMVDGGVPRFQSQCTQFDQNLEDDQRDSFYGHDDEEESSSQMQDDYGSLVDS